MLHLKFHWTNKSPFRTTIRAVPFFLPCHFCKKMLKNASVNGYCRANKNRHPCQILPVPCQFVCSVNGPYTTSVLGTAPLKMSTRAQNFEHGTSVFCRVNAIKIGTGAEKVEGAETFSRGSLGTSSKQCRAQILKKSKICLASRMRKIICSLPK